MLGLLKKLANDERSSGSVEAAAEPAGPPPMTLGDVWKPRKLRELKDDQSGAIMIMGVFMAVMLVGLIYYVVGIGDAILYRERMQDAADSAAFAGAVLHARGMNFIALINIVMAALLAILVALKLVETLAWIGIGVIYAVVAASLGTLSALLAFVPPLQAVANGARSAYNALRPPIQALLRVCDTTEEAIARVVPVVAQARVVSIAASTYRPTAQFGFAWPLYRPLPVVDDTFERLCEKAGETAGRLALLPFFFIPSRIRNAIAGALGDLASTFSAWFCGSGGTSAGGGGPPSLVVEETVPLPDNADGDAAECQATRTDSSADPAACERYQLWAQAGDACVAAGGSGPSCGSEYEERILRARSECRPGSHPDMENWGWIEQDLRRTETWTWVWDNAARTAGHYEYTVTAPEPAGPSSSNANEDRPPCGSGGIYSTAWNMSGAVCEEDWVFRGRDCPGESDPGPICISAADPLSGGREVYTREIIYHAVTEVTGCTSTTEREEVMDDQLFGEGEGPTSGGSCNMCPKKVIDGCQLGQDRFQLRAFVIGDSSRMQRADQGVRVAAWRQETGGDIYTGAMDIVSRLSIAQAEYFYSERGETSEGDTRPRAEWMWHMLWTARMRRIHFSMDDTCEGAGGGGPSPDVDSACSDAAGGAGGDCGSSGGGIGDFLGDAAAGILVH